MRWGNFKVLEDIIGAPRGGFRVAPTLRLERSFLLGELRVVCVNIPLAAEGAPLGREASGMMLEKDFTKGGCYA